MYRKYAKDEINSEILDTIMDSVGKYNDNQEQEAIEKVNEDINLTSNEKEKALKSIKRKSEYNQKLRKESQQIIDNINKIDLFVTEYKNIEKVNNLIKESNIQLSSNILNKKIYEIMKEINGLEAKSLEKIEHLGEMSVYCVIHKEGEEFELEDLGQKNEHIISAEEIREIFSLALKNTVLKRIRIEDNDLYNNKETEEEKKQKLINVEMGELNSAKENLKIVVPQNIQDKIREEGQSKYSNYLKIRNKRLFTIDKIQELYSKVADLRFEKENIEKVIEEINKLEELDEKSRSKIIGELKQKKEKLLNKETKIIKKIEKEKEKRGLNQTISREQKYREVKDLEEKLKIISEINYEVQIEKLKKELSEAEKKLHEEHKKGEVKEEEHEHIYINGDAYEVVDEETGKPKITPRYNTNALAIEKAEEEVNKIKTNLKNKEEDKITSENKISKIKSDLDLWWNQEITYTLEYDKSISLPFYLRIFSKKKASLSLGDEIDIANRQLDKKEEFLKDVHYDLKNNENNLDGNPVAYYKQNEKER